MQPYNPEWQDMSDYLVHFTKDTPTGSSYDNIMSILWNGTLQAGTVGMARKFAPDIDTQRAVCFSEVPLHLIERIARERGQHGIGFTKQFILNKGGGPIWYVERGGVSHNAVRTLIRIARDQPKPAKNPIWALTPFMDSHGGTYQYEWEREWRHPGSLNFSEKDVSFLIIPEELHESAREFFEEALMENTGPAYFCPYIDIGWSQDQIREAFEEHSNNISDS